MALLMKYKFQFFLCLLFLCMLNPFKTFAQADSLNIPPDGKVYFEKNDSTNNQDTAVQQTHLPEVNISKYKKSHDFYYMRFLDSLLRKQKDLRTDTVSVNEKTGRINRVRMHKRNPSPFNSFLNSWPLRIFFWSLAIIFIAFISYKVFFKNGFFSTRKKLPVEVNETVVPELSETSEYDTLISEAEKNNELNLATRFLFLKTLKTLSDKGFINFSPDKTNKEYLREMQQHSYFTAFRNLTRDYEYIWYGQFVIGVASV